ncbi:MAG: hypothetical protein IT376_17750 [Polyangiaceae bacterium]|nr:hypothetical protein [Polyangiaceae bacterium]
METLPLLVSDLVDAALRHPDPNGSACLVLLRDQLRALGEGRLRHAQVERHLSRALHTLEELPAVAPPGAFAARLLDTSP